MGDGQRQGPGQGRGEPASVTQALGLLHQALDHLAAADAASLPSSVQAAVLRGLEQAAGKQVAARSRVLAAFAGQAAYEADGQRTARAWLAWQTRVTTGAAAGAVGWARRLACHPVIGDRPGRRGPVRILGPPSLRVDRPPPPRPPRHRR